MKAATFDRFGPPDVVSLKEVLKPAPKAGEVRIRVHATTVTTGDWRIRSQIVPRGFGFLSKLVFGFNAPRKKILGTEFSGTVDEMGSKVTGFKVGDAVSASVGMAMGAHAEYVCISEKGAIVPKPSNLSFEEAATLGFGATTAWVFLSEKAKVSRGQKVLINGASGCLGSFGIQIAKHLGAEVTGVCSGANVELVQTLGADRVVDYTRENVTQRAEKFDVIFDTVGKLSFESAKSILTEKGIFLAPVATLTEFGQEIRSSMGRGQKLLGGVANETAARMQKMKELAESGAIKPLIGKTLPFDQVVEAHRIVDSGHKKGSVVLKLV